MEDLQPHRRAPRRRCRCAYYDVNGFVSSKVDFNGNTTTFSHDARGLETSRTEASGTALARTITTTWHPGFRLPTQIVEPGRTTDFGYDSAGNLTQKTVTSGGQTHTSTWTYNLYGQALTLDGPRTDLSDVTTYAYDASASLTTVTNALNHVTSVTGYDAHGRPLSISDPNGLITTLTYDPRGRLTSRNVGGETTGYTYDGVGQLTRVTLPNGAYLNYTFDAAHRLTQITDQLGNKIVYNNYSINATKNQIASITVGTSTLTYVHDLNGAITGDGTHTFTYDVVGRLTQAKQGSTVKGTYTFNGLGQRVKKVAGGTTTLFAYDEAGHLLGEYNATGGLVQETVWLGDTPIATIRGTTAYYVHADHLNAPRKVVDAAQAARWQWDYASFGSGTANQNPAGLGTFTYNLRFPGQYYDAETGLHHNYFRDYDPKTGRYIESDPIGLAGGINTYLYANANPLMFTDPLGLYTEVAVWQGVGVGSSSFGHVSTNINGANYSFGPGGWDKQSTTAAQYNSRQQEFRGGTGVILNLSPQQEAALASCLKGHSSAYSAIANNCGNPVQECLKAVGAGIGNSILPSSILENLRSSPNARGSVSYPSPRPSSGFGDGLLWH